MTKGQKKTKRLLLLLTIAAGMILAAMTFAAVGHAAAKLEFGARRTLG
jgi:hypothetical protein